MSIKLAFLFEFINQQILNVKAFFRHLVEKLNGCEQEIILSKIKLKNYNYSPLKFSCVTYFPLTSKNSVWLWNISVRYQNFHLLLEIPFVNGISVCYRNFRSLLEFSFVNGISDCYQIFCSLMEFPFVPEISICYQNFRLFPKYFSVREFFFSWNIYSLPEFPFVTGISVRYRNF